MRRKGTGPGHGGREHPLDVVVRSILTFTTWMSCFSNARYRSSNHETPWVAGSNPDLFSGEWICAVVERQFKDFRHIEVSMEDIGFFAEGSRFHTSARSSVLASSTRLPHAELFHDHRF
jgi:hypothetical protein